MGPRNLTAAVRHYCGRELTGAHSAEADSDATIDVLLAQLERYPDLPRDVKGLHEFCKQHSGKERDATGLIYFGARYLDPWTGRWLSPDPGFTLLDVDATARPAESVANYTYVLGNPIAYFDDDGRETLQELLNAAVQALQRAKAVGNPSVELKARIDNLRQVVKDLDGAYKGVKQAAQDYGLTILGAELRFIDLGEAFQGFKDNARKAIDSVSPDALQGLEPNVRRPPRHRRSRSIAVNIQPARPAPAPVANPAPMVVHADRQMSVASSRRDRNQQRQRNAQRRHVDD